MRLLQGRFDVETVYAEDPSEVARRWERAGAKWIHVVDLDGALRGSSVNEGVVRRILEEVRVDVQLGGGIRSMEAIERWLSLGVKRVVLGTAAVKDPGFLRDAIREFGERVALSLDVKGGEVMLEGWRKPSGIKALQMAARAKEMGLSLLIYTDILKDGTSSGPNLEGAREIASVGPPVILSGGVASLRDLELASRTPGIIGVIIGRALYEGRIDLEEAIRRFGD